MSFRLTKTTVTLDDKDFEAFVNEDTNVVYFAERIGIKGILNFGTVRKDRESKIDLEEAGISCEVALGELFAFTPNGKSDEVYLNLYVKNSDRVTPVHRQKISAGQMPYDIPAGIVRSNMIIGVEPTVSDATIILYVKPVAVIFEAFPNLPSGPQGGEFQGPQGNQAG